MAISVIRPALEMAKESGVLVNWLKKDGEAVQKGEPLMEIETDKVTVEIEASASGILGGIQAAIGDVIPVGQTIAWILAPGETPPAPNSAPTPTGRAMKVSSPPEAARKGAVDSSPLARKIAEEHGIDLASVKSHGKRIQKADRVTAPQNHAY